MTLGADHAGLVTPGDSVAAFIVTPDSLFLLRSSGARDFLGTGCRALVSVAADASRFLCDGYGTVAFIVLHSDGSTGEQLTLPAGLPASRRAARWGATGIEGLYWDAGRVAFYRARGASGPLSGTVPDSALGHSWNLSWSADGLTALYWTTGCAAVLVSCLQRVASLYRLDVATGGIVLVARHKVSTRAPSLQVRASPTGSAAAYSVEGELYLLSLR